MDLTGPNLPGPKVSLEKRSKDAFENGPNVTNSRSRNSTILVQYSSNQNATLKISQFYLPDSINELFESIVFFGVLSLILFQ